MVSMGQRSDVGETPPQKAGDLWVDIDEGALTGWISASPEGGSLYDLTPPAGGTAGIGRAFDLDLFQCCTDATMHRRQIREADEE